MTTSDVASRTALVVEDEPLIARVCAKTLRTEGFNVDLAINGLMGCAMASKKSYDLFVADRSAHFGDERHRVLPPCGCLASRPCTQGNLYHRRRAK